MLKKILLHFGIPKIAIGFVELKISVVHFFFHTTAMLNI